MAFSDEEVAYLQSQGLARLATLSPTGLPDVVPVAYEFDGEQFWVGGSGDSVLRGRVPTLRKRPAAKGQPAVLGQVVLAPPPG